MELRKAIFQTASFISGLISVILLFVWVSVVFSLGDPALDQILPKPVLMLPLLSILASILAIFLSPDIDNTLRDLFEALLESILDF